MYGGSNSDWIGHGLGGCTDTQYKTHFALWAMMGSPLMIGCDIRKATPFTKELLQNKNLLAINQDPESRGAYRIPVEPNWFGKDDAFVLVKTLADGDLAIGLFNFTDNTREITLQFWDIGLPYQSGYGLSLYDCFTNEDLGVCRERFAKHVDAHDCVVVRAKLTR